MSTSKMWKSDGAEQKYLEKLFQEKEVNASMKPSEVQKKYPMFIGFTSTVFRKHWNNTKHMFDGSVLCSRNVDNALVEIDGLSEVEPVSKKPKITPEASEHRPTDVEFKQPPVITSTFSDPDSKQMKCLVIVMLFSNIRNIEFDVLQLAEEQTLKISYHWPQSAFTVSDMFKKEGASQMFVNKMHPKFLATEMALQAVRENFEEAPVGTIEIKLPVAIQMEPSTWVKYFNKKKDGTLLVFFEFQCRRDDYIISKTEKSMSFD